MLKEKKLKVGFSISESSYKLLQDKAKECSNKSNQFVSNSVVVEELINKFVNKLVEESCNA